MRILLLGQLKSKPEYTTRKIKQELKKRGHTVNHVLWRELVFEFSNKKGVKIRRKKGKGLRQYDAIIARSPNPSPTRKGKFVKYLAMSRLYEHFALIASYVKGGSTWMLNSKTPRRLAYYDKLAQYFLLTQAGLPVVPSVLYTGHKVPPSVYKKFSFPYIAKSIEGSKGRDVFQIKDKEKIRRLIRRYGFGKIIIQKYLPITHDFRILVLGGKVIGVMKRVIARKGEFKTNFSAGGYVEKASYDPELEKFSLRATKLFRADFTGVDIIKYKKRYYIVEVNLFPGFEGFEKATQIKVAKALVDYLEKVKQPS